MTNAAKVRLTTCFAGIVPRGLLLDVIQVCKREVLRIAGDQEYLSHTPHLTMYLSVFEDTDRVYDALGRVASRIIVPKIQIEGWDVFAGDCMTGGNTLVMKINDADKQALRTLQRQIINQLAPLRDTEASANRYRPHFASFSEARRQAVENLGFPFVGDDWQPHFTIASVRQEDWHKVWEQFDRFPIHASFDEMDIGLFQVEDGHPRLIEVF